MYIYICIFIYINIDTYLECRGVPFFLAMPLDPSADCEERERQKEKEKEKERDRE